MPCTTWQGIQLFYNAMHHLTEGIQLFYNAMHHRTGHSRADLLAATVLNRHKLIPLHPE